MKRTILFAVASVTAFLAIVIGTNTDVSAGIVADYEFNNDFTSSVAGAPDLTLFGLAGSFSSTTIGGNSQNIYTFGASTGLDFDNTSSHLGQHFGSTYTVAMLMEFDTLSYFTRLLNFSGGVNDYGLYYEFGRLRNYYYGAGSYYDLIVAVPNQYATVVLTNDNSGTIRGYVDGSLQWTQSYSAYWAYSENTVPGNLIRFFKDNGGEDDPGSVARIQLYDHVLSDSDVANLDLSEASMTSTPEPTSLAIFGIGALCFGGAAARRRRKEKLAAEA
ncbi:MAG: hypothetical protein COA78_02645 [Blastopirellula sp.]|nr:MAG: hypothetical protein COA78_02645 [Blastopirellula sp.]